MTDIADNVAATLDAVQKLAVAVDALAKSITTPPAVDLSGINTKLDTIIADLNPSPAPSPEQA